MKREVKLLSKTCLNSKWTASFLAKEGEEHCECIVGCKVKVSVTKDSISHTYVVDEKEYEELKLRGVFNIKNHEFRDSDVIDVLVYEEVSTEVELNFGGNINSLILSKDDVEALAIHFGLLGSYDGE